MNIIYENSNEQHVRTIYIYKKTADVYAYNNSDKTIKVNADTLRSLFEKNMITIIDGEVEYKPISFNITNSVGTLTYVKADTELATTAVLATLVSEEYVAG